MVYILCAFYAEAAGIIEEYGLKKQDTPVKFDVFENSSLPIRLVLTGTGMINAATAAGAVCTFYGVTSGDRIVNIGICAGEEAPGTVFIANKIINEAANRVFYPDMLLKTDLSESLLVTFPSVLTADMIGSYRQTLSVHVIFDMEAAGIFEACSVFTSPHCISFLKIVSDNGKTSKTGADEIRSITAQAMPQIKGYLSLVMKDAEADRNRISAPDDEYVRKLAEDMHCSVTMYNRLRQILTYASLTGNDHQKITNAFYESGMLPAKNKNTGKQVLDEIARRLI